MVGTLPAVALAFLVSRTRKKTDLISPILDGSAYPFDAVSALLSSDLRRESTLTVERKGHPCTAYIRERVRVGIEVESGGSVDVGRPVVDVVVREQRRRVVHADGLGCKDGRDGDAEEGEQQPEGSHGGRKATKHGVTYFYFPFKTQRS